MGSVELDLDQTANSLEKMDISEQQDEITLESLPTEILLHILQFLDVRFIVEVLSCVSSKFLTIKLSGRASGWFLMCWLTNFVWFTGPPTSAASNSAALLPSCLLMP